MRRERIRRRTLASKKPTSSRFAKNRIQSSKIERVKRILADMPDEEILEIIEDIQEGDDNFRPGTSPVQEDGFFEIVDEEPEDEILYEIMDDMGEEPMLDSLEYGMDELERDLDGLRGFNTRKALILEESSRKPKRKLKLSSATIKKNLASIR